MTWVAVAVAGAAVVGAGASYLSASEQADASKQAADTQAGANRYAADLQAQATAEATALQKEMYYKNLELQQPWLDVGKNALARIQGGEYGLPESFKVPAQYALPTAFTGKVDLTQDPGYAFRLKEGLKTLDRTASARGGLLSGGALKAATAYGQEMGSQEYSNAYNRALTQYNADVARSTAGYSRALDEYNAAVGRSTTGYNRLASLANVGQTTANQIGGAGSTLATNVGNLNTNAATNIGNLYSATGASTANSLMAGANARASAYQGIGSSIGQGVGAYLNYNQNQSFLNALNNYKTGGGYSNPNTYSTQVYDAQGIPLTASGGYGFGD